ncbi:MAG TPA: hypothetical protein VGK06_02105 [Methanosarcina sp.]
MGTEAGNIPQDLKTAFENSSAHGAAAVPCIHTGQFRLCTWGSFRLS